MRTKWLTVFAAIGGACLSLSMLSTIFFLVDQLSDHGKTCNDIRHSPAALSTSDLCCFLAVMIVSMIPGSVLLAKCKAVWRAALSAAFGLGSLFLCSMAWGITALGTSCWGNM